MYVCVCACLLVVQSLLSHLSDGRIRCTQTEKEREKIDRERDRRKEVGVKEGRKEKEIEAKRKDVWLTYIYV